jgi:Fe-S-cluster containining protein
MPPDISFPCTRCGLCCRRVGSHDLYKHLDRGDGVCRNLIEASSLCSIYEQRPLSCNIDAMYDAYFSKLMTREDYYATNIRACNILAADERASQLGEYTLKHSR